MKVISKFFLSTSLVLFSIIGLPSLVHGFEFGLGARAGLEGSIDSHWAGDRYVLGPGGSGSWVVNQAHLPFSLNFTGGVFADFRFGDCNMFALTTAVNFSIARRSSMDIKYTDTETITTLRVSHNTFDVDVLAKFFLGWWYVGVGPGITFNTAPMFKDNNGNNVSVDSRKGYVGANFVLDTGLYIPLGYYSSSNILIGWRSVVDVTSFYQYLSMANAIDSGKSYSPKAVALSLFSTGVTVGYVHRFIN